MSITFEAMIDDTAVKLFAVAMKQKMALSRAKGREEWRKCSTDELWEMLREHVTKGDPVDVANIAMMIWHNEGNTDAERNSREERQK